MLNLERKPGESVVITLPSGEVVTVTFCGFTGGQYGLPKVRLGVEAPRHVPVVRAEAIK